MEIDFWAKEGKQEDMPCWSEIRELPHSLVAGQIPKELLVKIGTAIIHYIKDTMEKDGIIHLTLYMAMFL